MTLSITTFSIKELFATLSMHETQNKTVIMLNVVMLSVIMLNAIMLNVIMLRVVKPNVIIMSDVMFAMPLC
jgi:hypothetical protein